MSLQVRVKVLFVFDGSVEEIPDGEEDSWRGTLAHEDGRSQEWKVLFHNGDVRKWMTEEPKKNG